MGEIHLKPYKGYIVIPRAVVLLFLSNTLQLLEFGTYLAFASECDWDKKHETYGCVNKTDKELADRWHLDISTIWRYKQKLLAKGLLVNHGKLVKIQHFELFDIGVAKRLASIPLATPQELFANLQNIIAKPQEDIANLQDYQDQNRPQSFNVSSKGDLSLSNNEDDSFSDEELDRITKEIDEMRGGQT